MEAQEAIKLICETLVAAFGNAAEKTLPVTASVNRGTCAGSVTYSVKPERTLDEAEIVKLVRDAYAANGLTIDMASDAGVHTFFRVFLEACRNACSDNERVQIAHLLVFEPQVYADDANRAWMKPLMVNSDFNGLPSKVQLASSRAFIRRKRQAAAAKPYNNAARAEKVGRVTQVTCPKCGEKITIEATE